MGFLENRRGIPPSYAAARAALPAALAADLCLTGRLLEADEAQRLGVVTEVHAPDDLMPRAARVAAEIAAAPPSASIETKRRILIERSDVLAAALRGRGAGAARRAARAWLAAAASPACSCVWPSTGRREASPSSRPATAVVSGTLARRSVPPLQSGQRFRNRLRRRSIP